MLSIASYAQQPQSNRGGTITGRILDSDTKDPLSRANVNVVSAADSSIITGAMSDKNGDFEISSVKPGNYFVKVNYVGYTQYLSQEFAISRDNKNIDLKTVALKQSSLQTAAVDVVAEKQMMEYSQGKKIFNVDKNIASAGGTAVDILKNIPSVSVDVDGNVSLRGSSSMRVLVNGKPTTIDPTVLFEQMPAESIESIEIITNPSARYEAEGMAGIINLVLKKNTNNGINGIASINIGTGDKYSFSLNTSYKVDGFNLFGSYDYGNRRMRADGNSYRETRFATAEGIDTTIMDQDIKRRRNFYNHNIRLGFDYDLTELDQITIAGSYRTSESERGGGFTTNYYDGSQNLIDQNERHSLEKDKGPNADMSLNYRHNFAEKGHDLTFDFSYSYNDDKETTDYNVRNLFPTPFAPFLENSSLAEINKDINAQVDYVYPFGDYKFEAGTKFSAESLDGNYIHFFQDSISSDWLNDANKTNHFVYNQEVIAAYSIFSGKYGDFNYQFGLRAENSNIKTDLRTTNQVNTKNYFDFFPSFSFGYKLAKGDEVQLNYSRRIYRPHTHFLNPFTDYSDPNNLRTGNPYIDPEYIDAYEISYMKNFKWLSITPAVFYRQTNNKISYFTELVSPGVFRSTFANLAKGTDYGLELNVSFDYFKWMRLSTDLSYYRSEVKGASPSLELDNNNYSWSLRGNANFYATKELSLQIMGYYSAPTLTAQGKRYGWNSIDFAARYDLWNRRASVTFRLSDVFNQSEFGGTASSSSFYSEYSMKRESRVANIGFQYKINEGPKQKESRKIEESGGAGFDEF